MTFAMQNLTAGQLNAIVKKLGGEEGARRLLRDEIFLSSLPDFTVIVNRTIKPSYPDGLMGRVVHPGLELTGPTEYSLERLDLLLHDDQKNGQVFGRVIYEHLMSMNILIACLNLQDGFAIEDKGITIFRKLFGRNRVFLWGSVVSDQNGCLVVPYLYGIEGRIEMLWRAMDYRYWGPLDLALHFRNK